VIILLISISLLISDALVAVFPVLRVVIVGSVSDVDDVDEVVSESSSICELSGVGS
jgi:hypothetical protein